MGNRDDDARLMERVILVGGPRAGFNTNLKETETDKCFIEVDGQKLVCVAQGGECRYNHKYYTPGMGDAKSWRTPVINLDCPDRCGYKMIVCDGHGEKCEGSIEYYPQYNKFQGKFKKYCRNFDKFLKEEGEREIKSDDGDKDRGYEIDDRYM